MSDLQREVLRWVGDEYESGETIRENVARALGRAVAGAEVSAALAALVREGCVAAFRYDKSEEAFERVAAVPEGAAEGLWFLALPRGRLQSDRASL